MAFFKSFLAFGALFLASTFLLMGTGLFPQFNAGLSLCLCAVIILFTASKRAFYFLFLPVLVLHILYIPTGLNFGAPNYQYVISLFATDILETKEFLAQISFWHYLMALSVLPLILFFYAQTRSLKLYQNRLFIFCVALLFFSYSPLSQFIQKSVSSFLLVKDEMAKLKNLSTQPSDWGNATLTPSPYEDYVLIIGESARKDYLHAYGYPIENTPFLSQTNGTIIDGFTSAGINTVASLRLMLTQPNTQTWQPNYGLSLIDLIKSAGIHTYWLSNQGSLGEYDTPIAALASKSDESIFLKTGTYNSANHNDTELLPLFQQKLNQPSQKKRFFVLHLYGSHPLACDRLLGYPKILDDQKIKPQYHYLNCYISSIKQTDELLKQVYQTLKDHQAKTQRAFSMVYFSDHGLCHENPQAKDILFNQNCVSQYHNQIPLVKISSDDQKRHVFRVFKSGLNFTDGIAHWLSIQNARLNPNADLFSNTPDPSDYGLAEQIRQRTTPPDPAIDIRP